MDYVIYGAQGMALGAYRAMRVLFPERNIRCFLVTNYGRNAKVLGGLPVRELSDFVSGLLGSEKEKIRVLICTPEVFMADIERNLNEAGLNNYQRVDSEKWAQLMNKAFYTDGSLSVLSRLGSSDERPDTSIFLTKFWKDKELSGEYRIPDILIPIQAGAAVSDERIADLTDDTGENISDKNPDYSELTALYWIWKNRILPDDQRELHYYGICHYRRLLMIGEEDLGRLKGNKVDAVLPYPMPYEPDIEEHHKRYLKDFEWNAALQALLELYPEESDRYQSILKQNYMYNYNIILARGDVLCDYCLFLFSILSKTEEILARRGDGQPGTDRYAGYIGETMETLYFMANKDRYNLAHTGCKFLV